MSGAEDEKESTGMSHQFLFVSTAKNVVFILKNVGFVNDMDNCIPRKIRHIKDFHWNMTMAYNLLPVIVVSMKPNFGGM